jgi:hypothetical protein
MPDWLKLIGSARSPITEWEKPYVGFRKANKPSIRTGDHLFLYAPGDNRRIFALAVAVSDPEQDSDYNPSKEGSCRWKLRVRYDINLPVISGILIEEVSSQRDLAKSLRQAFHIRLFPEESDSANSKLIGKQISFPKPGTSAIPGYVRVADSDASPSLDVDIHTVAATEGRRRLVLHLQRERNQTVVRNKKRQAASLDCEVCGFSFSRAYGSAASDYCEVHHLLPLSDVEDSTQTRIGDLAILCANCHRVVHLHNPPYTLTEVRSMLAK